MVAENNENFEGVEVESLKNISSALSASSGKLQEIMSKVQSGEVNKEEILAELSKIKETLKPVEGNKMVQQLFTNIETLISTLDEIK